VRHYQPEASPGGEVTTPEQPGETLTVTEEAPAPTEVTEGRRVVISISQTSDEDRDIAYLHKVIDTLKDFPGQDEVNLRVTNGEKVVNLKLSSIYTGYCPELLQRLAEFVGEEGVRLEPSETV